MIDTNVKRMVTFGNLVKCAAALALLGTAFYGFERWGEQSMSRFAVFVGEQGDLGPIVFALVNAIATMCLVPQSVFTITAGALFGWKIGTACASIAMTAGAVGSFLIARYSLRDWLRDRLKDHVVFKKMQRLSLTHPVHVISLSRLIPVIPFPVASYMLGVTQVRSLHFALFTWLCMLPETLFLASGGHLLHTGIVHGHVGWEAMVAVALAGIGLVVLAHKMKKKFLEKDAG